MILSFNVQTAERTIDRMALSVVVKDHWDAYTNSCYGRVCHYIRDLESWQPEDKIVLLGLKQGKGVIHGTLMRGDKFLVDSCSDRAILSGDEYTAPSTTGAQPTRLYVKGEISLDDFHVKCLRLQAEVMKAKEAGEDFKSMTYSLEKKVANQNCAPTIPKPQLP